MKTIGVLTSGGDAPGMNAAIRAVVRTACQSGLNVFGIKRGYDGLINNDMQMMDLRSVSDIIDRGGTILFSARSEEFRTQAGIQKAIDVCRMRGIEGLVVIGGDGSFRGAKELSEQAGDIRFIGIPGTIDNDIPCCDYTIGYDTCMNTIMEMVDRIRDTSESHGRCFVVEAMGRYAGHLALNAGISVGATCILVPEVPYDFEEDVIKRLKRFLATGKQHFIIMVAEGVWHVNGSDQKGSCTQMAKEIERLTGIESRAVILGHVQRGGSPTVRDRVIASRMGYMAVNLLMQGQGNRIVAMQNEKLLHFDMHEAAKITKCLDRELYDVAHIISI